MSRFARFQSLLPILTRMGLLPIVIYFALFCVLTYPLILVFSTHFFCDQGDGLLNVWNIWWTNKAVTELHQSPWHTTYLHYPHGVSLLGHTLTPFNGFVGILLLRFLTLTQTYNTLIIFTFVAGGLTAFLLAHYITRCYWSSLVAGFIFTFSQYHIAQSHAHLNLASLEWIPLFILSCYAFIIRPSVKLGIASALALFAVFLCDYYYFLYCFFAAWIVIIWYSHKKKTYFLTREHWTPLAAFAGTFLLTIGPFLAAIALLIRRDPLMGGHVPKRLSMDLLNPFIPGFNWRFAGLTEAYWSKVQWSVDEQSVYLGMSVIFLLVYVAARRKKLKAESIWLWYAVAIFFGILSLGPVLHVWGKELSFVFLPYALFEKVFPIVTLGGVPVRMMVMVFLSASVLSAIGLKELFRGSRRSRWLAMGILVLILVEYWPATMYASRVPVPEYVQFLRDRPEEGAILESTANEFEAAYYQTIHERPMAFGVVSRLPQGVAEKVRELLKTFDDGRYDVIWREYQIRYLVLSADREAANGPPPGEMIYSDEKVSIYDLVAGQGNPSRGNGL